MHEYDYDCMTLSLEFGEADAGTGVERGALPGTQENCLGPRCTCQVHYLGQVHWPGALLGPSALAGPVAPEQPGPDGGALLAAGRGHLDMMQVNMRLNG